MAQVIPELASTLYDSFLGLRGEINYNATPTIEYPTADMTSTFGTVYLPRVYGLDLTAFEIASSGSVALTLNDVHSLDITRNDTASNVTLSTLCNDTLSLSVGTETTVAYTLSTSSNAHMFAVNSNNVLIVDASGIRIDGDLVLTGVIDAQNILESSLVIEDKVIYLAHSSSNLEFDTMHDDGQFNDGSGIYVSGIPAGLSNVMGGSNYEKSIRWNYGSQGTLALGTSNVGDESFWDVKGGALKITHVKTDDQGNYEDEIAFRFRINERDELELVKHYTQDNVSLTRRVARFGLTHVQL
jgi:hypothetical protein